MLPRVIVVCALCAYHALTIEKARQLLEAAMQYAGHRRAVEKAGVPAGWSAAAAIEKLEGAIRTGEGKRGSALLPHKTLAAARAEVAELKALQAKERAAAEKAAEEKAAAEQAAAEQAAAEKAAAEKAAAEQAAAEQAAAEQAAAEKAVAEKFAASDATLKGHTNSVTSVCSLRGGRLASGSVDKTVRVWWAAMGKCVATL